MYPTAHFLSVIDMHSFSEQAIICRWHFIALLFIHIIALSHTTVVDTVHESLLARKVILLFIVVGEGSCIINLVSLSSFIYDSLQLYFRALLHRTFFFQKLAWVGALLLLR